MVLDCYFCQLLLKQISAQKPGIRLLREKRTINTLKARVLLTFIVVINTLGMKVQDNMDLLVRQNHFISAGFSLAY